MKFTPCGGKIELCFDVISHEEAIGEFPQIAQETTVQYVKISVTDTGSGIPEEQLERIFERYYQLNNQAGHYNWGTGIGLYYARSLAELHHGHLKAGNRQGGTGAVFILILPIGDNVYSTEEIFAEEEKQSKAFPLSAEEPCPQDNTGCAENKKQTLLVVDDDTEVAHYLKALLSPHYRVICRFNADSAIKAVNEELPDLVLSDVVMPEKNGYELCRQIKEDLQLCHIPVVLVTAQATIELSLIHI